MYLKIFVLNILHSYIIQSEVFLLEESNSDKNHYEALELILFFWSQNTSFCIRFSLLSLTKSKLHMQKQVLLQRKF